MFKFITNKPFWLNLIAVLALGILLLFLFLKTLGWLTKHGDYLKVPAVTGLKTDAAIKLLEKQGFDVFIQDSIFTDTAKRGIVLKQLPDPNALVKINRSVYLTVNRYVPPMIEMPNLEGLTLPFAMKVIERNHLKLGDTSYRPDFMMGSVLEQRFNGMRISDKTKIQWGSTIDLVIGGGLESQTIPVPSLLGMTYAEAKQYLADNGISEGAILSDGQITDTASAFVVRQRPERFDADKRLLYIQSGQLMDLWLSQVMKNIGDSLTRKNDY